eukprot:CAMPEP_0179263010 /NCGR_PEP_ID=MMETSP0797-20121207/27660_1 /TAXON_ID=47934 /ORGANISM="Dinophysis acuminata, Strain DAEP01" /LENGTH=265 /DNA_ID=CAMNT_0020971159 /DNA_START=173 /DNA_END=970 /DNA_ORIENTATION=-
MVSSEDARIFARKLPVDIKEKEVRYIFSKYGTIVSVDVILWPAPPTINASGSLAPVELNVVPGKTKLDWQACALITYSTVEAAATAIRALHNVYRARSSSSEPISVCIARSAVLPEPAQPPVPTPAQVPAADIGNAPVVFATKDGNRVVLPAAPAFRPMADQMAEKVKCKLFVGNLAGNVTREAVTTLFWTWGRVVNCAVMTGKSKFGSACAYVELSTPEEAAAALKAMHQTYDNRIGAGTVPITVTHFQSQAKYGPPSARYGPY